jgi:hypothetical protein
MEPSGIGVAGRRLRRPRMNRRSRLRAGAPSTHPRLSPNDPDKDPMKQPILSHVVSAAMPLFLVAQGLTTKVPAAIATPPSVDTIVVVDVSGSMSGDLEDVRRHLKNKLADLVKVGDTFSLVFFSGQGQCGVLLEAATFDDLRDVPKFHAAIDRLRPIGLTGFLDPLKLAGDLAAKLRASRPKSTLRHVVFLSDGYHNDPYAGRNEARKAILAAVLGATADGRAQKLTTVGYGYGCDQALLQEMAAAAPCGGTFVFAQDFERYAPAFEASVSGRPAGAMRRKVGLMAGAVGDVAFTVSPEGEITQYAPDGAEILVPEDVDAVWYLSDRSVGAADEGVTHYARQASKGGKSPVVDAAYAALTIFAQRCQRKIVRALALALGDAAFVTAAFGAFGPQRYNDLADLTGKAVAGGGRFVAGFRTDMAPDPNAYTALNAVYALASGDNRVCPDHEAFSYTAITRKRLDAAGILTPTDLKEVAAVAVDLGALKAGDAIDGLDALVGRLAAIKADKAPKVTWSYLAAPEGYAVDGMVHSSEEANVSLRIKRAIDVDLTAALAELPPELRARVPTTFRSHRYQQFAIVTGRILNMKTLPVVLDAKTWSEFARAGLVSGPHRREPVVVDFSSLPIVNDSMVETISAKATATAAYALEQVKARKKVLDDARKKWLPKESSAIAEWIAIAGLVQAEAESGALSAWLDRCGLTDGGLRQSTTGAPPTDKRRSWLLDVALPGLSSLPTVAKVREKQAKIAAWQASPKGKEPAFTAGEALMEREVRDLDAFLKAEKIALDATAEKLTPAQRTALDAYLAPALRMLEEKRRALLFDLSKVAIIAIAGGEWFSDLAPGASDVEVTVGGSKLTASVGIKDVDLDV